jgi:hypothetical protein
MTTKIVCGALPLHPHVPIQSSFLELFEKETLKGKEDEKSRKPRPTILTSAVPGQLPKLSIEYPLEP